MLPIHKIKHHGTYIARPLLVHDSHTDMAAANAPKVAAVSVGVCLHSGILESGGQGPTTCERGSNHIGIILRSYC